jgi:predicted dehydrogenase
MESEEKNPNALTRRQFLGKASALSAFLIVPRYVLGGPGYVAPSDLINLGFIGTGKQSGGLRNNFLPSGEARIVAACDVYAPKLDQFRQQVEAFYAQKASQSSFKGCTPYQDFRELLGRQDLDAVVIVTPDHWHAVQAVMAANAGKDIYCEKPLSLTIAEGRALVDAARQNKRVFQTGSMQRSSPEFRQAVELVRNGYLGEIKNINVYLGKPPKAYDLPEQPVPAGLNWDFWLGPNEYQPFHNDLAPSLRDDFWARWRSYKEFGGGDITDWGAHMFDIAQWALDMDHSGPTEITPPDGKEHQQLTYRYANGVTMKHVFSESRRAVEFVGSEGRINVARGKLETTPASLKDKVIGPGEKRVYRSDEHRKDWLTAIRNRSRPICDVEVGHRTATVCTLGNIAYELNRPLLWDPKKEKFKKDPEANGMLSRPMRKEWAI